MYSFESILYSFVLIGRKQWLTVLLCFPFLALSPLLFFFFFICLDISSGLMWEWFENEMAWNAGKIANSGRCPTVEREGFVSLENYAFSDSG